MNRIFWLFFTIVVMAPYALGAAGGVGVYKHVINALPSGTSVPSASAAAVDMGLMYQGSVQCDFTGLTTTTGAVATVNQSDDGGTTWVSTSSTLSPTTGTSAAVVAFDHLNYQLYQVAYVPGSATGGAVNCWVVGK